MNPGLSATVDKAPEFPVAFGNFITTIDEDENSLDVFQESHDDQKQKQGSVQPDSDVGGDQPRTKKKKRPKNKKKSSEVKQTDPPTVDLCKFFENGKFPHGEELPYSGTNVTRINDEAKKAKELVSEDSYNDLRRAAEVHRQTREYIRGYVKPGMKMIDICERLEDTVRKLVNEDGLKAGIGFPTGVSLNECAAHYTPNPGDDTVLKYEDVMKIDFGVHVNGLIIDSAFTFTCDSKYDPLLAAVKEATNTGIMEAGIDARLSDIGAAIQEVMESHQIELDGKLHDIKCVRNLCGHSIGRYKIHSGQAIPIVANDDYSKMEEGVLYAIETFGSTGKGYVSNKPNCSHYMISSEVKNKNFLRQQSARDLYDFINKRFSTLPFCKRYLERLGQKSYAFPLATLVRTGFIDEYPPLSDIKGSYVAQFEHTVLLRPTRKEVLSRGFDY